MVFNSVHGPLFGSNATVGLRVFGSQVLPDGSLLSANLFNGFSGTRSGFIRYENFELRRWRAAVEAGDVFVTRNISHDFAAAQYDNYPILGILSELTDRGSTWRTTAGRARYALRSTLRRSDSYPFILSEQYSRTNPGSAWSAGVVGIVHPPFVRSSDDRGADAVMFGRYESQLTRRARAFFEGLTTSRFAPAFRAGLQHRSIRYRVGFEAYHFDARFPDVYPLFRPRETGLLVAGSVRLSESAALDVNANYTTRRVVNRGSSLYGTVSYFQTFGSDRPMLFASYTKSDVFIDDLSGRIALVLADRYSLGVRQGSAWQSIDLRADYVKNEATTPDRGQFLLDYARVLGTRTRFLSSVAFQKEMRDRGAIAEVAIERALRGPLSSLIGLRGAYLEREGVERADAAVRLGLSRRLTRDGWYGRVEARIPLSVGLPSTGLMDNALAAEIGRRTAWNTVDAIRSALLPVITPEAFGSIEGVVTLEGKPLRSATILINGVEAAASDSSGRFRISRVPVGPVTLSLDTSELEPGISSAAGFSRSVLVSSRSAFRVDFELARLKTLQTVIMRCTPAGEAPIPNARVTLIGSDFARTYETDSLGAFRDDALPAGSYEVLIDPSSIVPPVDPQDIPKVTIDLSKDVLRFFIRIGCQSRIGAATRTLRGKLSVCANARPSGVTIHLLGPAAVRSVVTGDDGSFSIDGLPPGPYLAVVETPGAPRTMIDLRRGDVTDLMIRAACR